MGGSGKPLQNGTLKMKTPRHMETRASRTGRVQGTLPVMGWAWLRFGVPVLDGSGRRGAAGRQDECVRSLPFPVAAGSDSLLTPSHTCRPERAASFLGCEFKAAPAQSGAALVTLFGGADERLGEVGTYSVMGRQDFFSNEWRAMKRAERKERT